MTRHTENARTLASLINTDSNEAAKLLEATIAITCDESDRAAMSVANDLRELLGRTVTGIHLNHYSANAVAEVVIGAARGHHPAAVRVAISEAQIQIGSSAPAAALSQYVPSIVLLIASCYATGMTLRVAFGERLNVPGPTPQAGMVVPVNDLLGSEPEWVAEEFTLADSYLAGAGAIGNGFLYALSQFWVTGSLVIADPDTVSDGNLNRCVFFTDADLGLPKASQLALHAASALPGLKLIPEVATLQEIGKTKESTWLGRLIVGVDSRRTRRHLQGEIPGQVFDASTTGAVECVLHHNKQPTDAACLACIYHETPDELAREQHIADTLGVDLNDVKQHHVSAETAARIHDRYPSIPTESLKGQAYDSLFKALCSEGKLLNAEDRQVLAPFAFVSVLAGAFLAIEVARRSILGNSAFTFNYWRLSPWAAPVPELKQLRPRRPSCEFCGQPVLVRTAARLWGNTTAE
jgi:hypothetical protein